MTLIYNRHKQTENRKYLRNNSTLAEVLLWQKLKNNQLGEKFRRQHGIGYNIADFCCPKKKIVIEVDGGIHREVEQKSYDKERTDVLEELGFKVIRFDNNEIKHQIGYVLEKIKSYL